MFEVSGTKGPGDDFEGVTVGASIWSYIPHTAAVSDILQIYVKLILVITIRPTYYLQQVFCFRVSWSWNIGATQKYLAFKMTIPASPAHALNPAWTWTPEAPTTAILLFWYVALPLPSAAAKQLWPTIFRVRLCPVTPKWGPYMNPYLLNKHLDLGGTMCLPSSLPLHPVRAKTPRTKFRLS